MALKNSMRLHSELTVAHHDFKKILNAHARAKIQDSTLSEDLVQETFMKTWVYLVKNGKIDLMKAFLFRVLDNLIVDEYRKHKTTSLELIMQKGFEPKNNIAESSDNRIDGKKAVLLIDNLPEKYKQILRMRYLQGLSIKEIHFITGQSENSIAVQAHRGLKKLRLLYNR